MNIRLLVFNWIAFTLLSLSFAEISTIPSCCLDGWSLVRIKMGIFRADKFDCRETTLDFADNIDRIGTIQEFYSYPLRKYHNETTNITLSTNNIPNCNHQTLLTISMDVTHELTQKSCFANIDNNLQAITCSKNDNDDDNLMLKISTVRKCCPINYYFDGIQRKCLKIFSISYDNYQYLFNNTVIFVDEPIDCPKDKVVVEYNLNINEFYFEDDGNIFIRNLRKSYNIYNYCLEEIIHSENVSKNLIPIFQIRLCDNRDLCKRLPCIRRCCADGEMFTKGNATTYCRKDDTDVSYHTFDSLDISGNFTKPAVFGILRSLDCLKFRLDPDAYDDEAHTISDRDGSLHVMTTRKNYTNNQYCIEKIRNSTWADQKLYTFLCFDSKVVGNDRIRFQMYPIGLLISCLFYAVTLIVYLSISRLRNLPGKILICLVTSLLAAYFGIALGQLMPTPNDDICFAFGFFVYFCLMAAFAWMNVMCFDIWQTFGSAKKKQFFKKSHTKRFIKYSLYGWGLPTILTATTVSLTKSDILSDNIRPQFGHGRCWFTYDTLASANLVFFSGPVGLLFLINFVLFSVTLRYCNKVKREIFRMQSTNMEKPALRRRFFVDKARFAMNTKLFIVMGITWLLELLSILFYDHNKTFFWIISDSFNVLLGVFVFFIFVFKKRVWYSILEKFGLRSGEALKSTPNYTCGVTQSTYAPSPSMMRLNIIDNNKTLLSPGATRRSPSM